MWRLWAAPSAVPVHHLPPYTICPNRSEKAFVNECGHDMHPRVLPDDSPEAIREFLGQPEMLSPTYDTARRPYNAAARQMQAQGAAIGWALHPQLGWSDTFIAHTYRLTHAFTTIAAVKANPYRPPSADPSAEPEPVSIGVAYALLNIDSLNALTRTFPFGPNGAIYVIDCNGAVLVSSQAQEVRRPVNASADYQYPDVVDVLDAVDPAPNSHPWLPAVQAQLRDWGLIAPLGTYLTPINASAVLGPSSAAGDLHRAHVPAPGRLGPAQTRGLPFVVVLCTHSSEFRTRSRGDTILLSMGVIVIAAALSCVLTRYATRHAAPRCARAMDTAVALMSSPGWGTPAHRRQLVELFPHWEYSAQQEDNQHTTRRPRRTGSNATQARSANVAKFRRAYDSLHLLSSTAPFAYSGAVHFAVLNAMALVVVLHCSLRIGASPSVHWLGGACTCVLAFLCGNLGEYCLHRFSMHHPDSRSDHSPVHHRYFTAGSMFIKSFQDCYTILFGVGFVFRMFFFVLPVVGAMLNAVVFPTCGYFALGTVACYYLQYEWLHLIYHTPPDSVLGRLPLVHLLRAHHRVHHHQPLMRSHNFNITYPLMDLLFGSYYRGPRVYDEAADHTPPPSFPHSD